MSCIGFTKNFLSVGGFASDTPLLSLSNEMMLFLVASTTQMCVSSKMCITYAASSERPSSSGVISFLLVGKRESMSTAWSLMSSM